MLMNVVIVESPAKAKTISKYLGPDYTVLASYGHIRDLPSKNGSVDPDANFAMIWDIDPAAKKRIKEIARAVKGADRLILATDPDREGEAISWHVLEVLNQEKALQGVTVERVVFNAITKKAVTEAMVHPRALDEPLVNAYLARRALDYLVGFTLSPVLWRKLPGSRSAGRVQSVVLRLVCNRELEIESFIIREYWSVEARLKTGANEEFLAKLYASNGKKLAKYDIENAGHATKAVNALKASTLKITSIESKPARRHPSAPFTTSSLQQEAAHKLGFAASRTMQTAQKLYEGFDIAGETVGLITYMRTDGVQIAGEAIAATRSVITSVFGDKYLPGVPRAYKTKAKNAQEAHEAIRPTDLSRLPDQVRAILNGDQFKLYELIWKRTVASQMESAVMDRTTADITATPADGGEAATLRATGSVTVFDGFLKLYQEDPVDKENGKAGDSDNASRKLPKLTEGESLSQAAITPNQHFTEPPPRYSEASLIRKMEELGIGRPSTYASTLSVIEDRGYVRIDKNRLIPEDKGRLVTAFLESFFTKYVEYDFTAALENQLDEISAGNLKWQDTLQEFWTQFSEHVTEIMKLRVSEVLDALNETLGPHVFPTTGEGVDPRKCPSCDDGQLSLKVGKFGAFVGCSNYPDCNFTRQFSGGDEGASGGDAGPVELGVDPETGQMVTLRSGRFGPYVQLGEPEKKGDKPKRAGIPKKIDPETVDLERALQLLSLPREIGPHPESGKMIAAGIGRFGPFVLCDGVYANFQDPEEVFSIGLNRAVDLIAAKIAKGGSARKAALKELGAHPDDGKPVLVMDGRYGPYVKHARTNATLPRDQDPQSTTLEQALELIAAKAAKGTNKNTSGKKPAAKKKKKPAAKKKTTKKKKKPAVKKTPAVDQMNPNQEPG